jgi:two-component system, NarL family, sensor histidine kinase DesK
VIGTILREAITNVLRHSRATLCHISLHVTCASITLRVANDGVTEIADSERTERGGLHNMAQRTAALGGTYHADRDGTWFRLLTTIPRDAT